jgi:hypothetical protein
MFRIHAHHLKVTRFLIILVLGLPLVSLVVLKLRDYLRESVGLVILNPHIIVEFDDTEKYPGHFSIDLKNNTNKDILVSDIKSGCGCTIPARTSFSIPGRSVARVPLSIDPSPSGEKIVPIEIKTDYQSSRSLKSEIKVRSLRKAPFLTDANGDLAYSHPNDIAELRTIYVSSIELSSSTKKHPVLSCDLSFVRIKPDKIISKPIIRSSKDSVVYTYTVYLDSSTPNRTFSGEIMVINPWKHDDKKTISIYRNISPLDIFPPEPELTYRSDRNQSTMRLHLSSRKHQYISENKWIIDHPNIPYWNITKQTSKDRKSLVIDCILNGSIRSQDSAKSFLTIHYENDVVKVPLKVRNEDQVDR